MKLRDYLTKHGLTQIQFGQLMTPPVSQARVSHWLNGRLRVSLADAVAIERLTDRQVAVEDWLELDVVGLVPEVHPNLAKVKARQRNFGCLPDGSPDPLKSPGAQKVGVPDTAPEPNQEAA